MRELFCTNPCGTNQPIGLVAAPCFVCLGDEFVPVPPNSPVLPATVEIGAPPPAQVLDSGNFVAGVGISAAHATTGTDQTIALFLAPLIAGVTGSEAAPVTGNNYPITLEAGQELAIAFGAALLSGANIRITDYYDVDLLVESDGSSTTLSLAEGESPTGLVWKDAAETYVITDSEGGPMNVQNVTRLTFLVDAGLLPVSALEPGVTLFLLRAKQKDSNTFTVAAAISVTVTEAAP